MWSELLVWCKPPPTHPPPGLFAPYVRHPILPPSAQFVFLVPSLISLIQVTPNHPSGRSVLYSTPSFCLPYPPTHTHSPLSASGVRSPGSNQWHKTRQRAQAADKMVERHSVMGEDGKLALVGTEAARVAESSARTPALLIPRLFPQTRPLPPMRRCLPFLWVLLTPWYFALCW